MLQVKKLSIGMLVLAGLVIGGGLFAVEGYPEKSRQVSECNSLDLNQLCVKKVNATCFDGCRVLATNLCAGAVSIEEASIDKACVDQLQAKDVCISGTLYAPNFSVCQDRRATAVFSVNTTYTLGTNIDYDLILDDPHGDASTSPFEYVASQAGYYLVSVQVDQVDLVLDDPAEPILGVPVANLEIKVNDIIVRQAYQPFLTFNNAQNTNITMIVSLKVGDVVRAAYEIFQITDTGLAPVAGTVTIIGNGTEQNVSIFKVVLLAADCTQSESPCPFSCSTVDCSPCFNTCCECASSFCATHARP